MADQFLSLEIIYEDEHLIELLARVSYAGWSAETRAYAGLTYLRAAIDGLAQFGVHLSGDATMKAGGEDQGFISLRFYTYGGARHLACHVRMIFHDNQIHNASGDLCPQEPWELSITLRTEAALLDRFIGELRLLADRKTDQAVLSAVQPVRSNDVSTNPPKGET